MSADERALLTALNNLGGRSDMKKIVSESGMNMGKAMMLAQVLQERKFVDVERMRKTVVELTDEGISHSKSGLPERRLLKALLELDGRASTERCLERCALTDHLKPIAIGWIVRKGWARLERVDEEAFLVATGEAEEGADERMLRLLSRESLVLEDSPPGMRETAVELKRRKLVSWRTIVDVAITLTEKGDRAVLEKGPVAKEITSLTPEIIKTGRWRQVRLKRYDVAVPPPVLYLGKKHPYVEFLEKVRRILLSMGFVEADGPYVETEFWNFDALFQAQDHPAREIHSSYRIKFPSAGRIAESDLVKRVKLVHESGWTTGSTGWGRKWSFDVARSLVLRTQGTAISVRYLASHRIPPIKMFAVVRVFRPEALDATHSMEFHHCEGIVMAENVNFRHLLGFLRTFANLLGFRKIKFRPGYFPFTEPSVESLVYHPRLGWTEILGGGIFRPEVTAPLGVEYPVLAWGIGIGRLAMASLGIDDIRDLFTQDLDMLRRL